METYAQGGVGADEDGEEGAERRPLRAGNGSAHASHQQQFHWQHSGSHLSRGAPGLSPQGSGAVGPSQSHPSMHGGLGQPPQQPPGAAGGLHSQGGLRGEGHGGAGGCPAGASAHTTGLGLGIGLGIGAPEYGAGAGGEIGQHQQDASERTPLTGAGGEGGAGGQRSDAPAWR